MDCYIQRYLIEQIVPGSDVTVPELLFHMLNSIHLLIKISFFLVRNFSCNTVIIELKICAELSSTDSLLRNLELCATSPFVSTFSSYRNLSWTLI